MIRKSLSRVARREIAGPALCCLLAGLLPSPSWAGGTPADAACRAALDAVHSALSPTGGDTRAVERAAWRACSGTNVDPRLTARASMLLLHGPLAERAETLRTLLSVHERLVAAGVHGRELIRVNEAIGTCQAQLGQREAALATALRGLEMREEHFGVNSVEAVVGVLNVAAYLQDDPERALTLVRETYSRLESELGEADPATLRALSGLAFLNQQLGRFEEAARLDERHDKIWRTLPEEAKEVRDDW
jgi:hypothetical protein